MRENPDFWKSTNKSTWKQELATLLASGDALGLKQCHKGLSKYVKTQGGAAQERALAQLIKDFKRTLQFKVIELCRLLDTYPWPSDKHTLDQASVDIKSLRKEIAACWPEYKDYGRAEFQALRQKLLDEKHPHSVFLEDDFTGYASDDSDDEEEEDPRPSRRIGSFQVPKKKKKKKSEPFALNRLIPPHMRNNPFAPLLVEPYSDFPSFALNARSKVKTFRRHAEEPDPQWVRAVAFQNFQARELTDDGRHTANAQIHHGAEWTELVEADFQRAKKIFSTLMEVEGDPNAAREDKEEARRDARTALRQLKTRFCIAQYRGITYKTSAFTRASRQSSRETVEVGQAIYSLSVFQAARVDPATYFSGRCTELQQRALEVAAGQIKEVLLNKRDTGPCKYLGYQYDSQAHALQDTYTNNYDYFHSAIQVSLANMQGHFEKMRKEVLLKLEKDPKYTGLPTDELKRQMVNQQLFSGLKQKPEVALYEGLLNAECPFVSTGDVPRHALKYAYGKKFYKGHYHERLLTRWNPDGVAERPYVGKVYATLHGLEDYIDDAPLHVRSLNNKGKIVVGGAIALERETTYPAFIPAQRMILEHIAKIPSFRDGWSPVFLEKYGIAKKDYDRYYGEVRKESVQSKKYGEFPNPDYKDPPPKPKPPSKKKQGEVQAEPPQEPEDPRLPHEKSKTIDLTGGSLISLDSWLVNFHEVRLIELTRRVARSRGEFLIYRDEFGELSRELPVPLNEHAIQGLMDLRKKNRTENRVFDQSLIELRKKLRSRSLDTVLAESYEVKDTLGDGNCLFHALSAALADATGAVKSHDTLRTEICDELARSPDVQRQQRIDAQYIERMRQPARNALDVERWGSDAEIIAFCRIYPVRVRVFSYTYPAPGYYMDFERFGGVINHTLLLFNQGGNHWTWLREP